MCGIAGVIGTHPEMDSRSLAHDFLRSLKHRGPDDHGWLTYSRTGIQLGRSSRPTDPADALFIHRRLSILDLSNAGWQPMVTSDRRWAITYNGEIYNFLALRAKLTKLECQFRSNSDTEVLLQAIAHWGPACLPELVGMFAMAVMDCRERRVWLVRDFFGIKPLYYTTWAGGLAFASEIKTLLSLPWVRRRIHPGRLFDYLRWGRTDHGTDTLYAGIQQVPAGHFLELSIESPEGFRLRRFWGIKRRNSVDLSFKEAASRLREMFVKNVNLHLQSDVPVGAALSGGIDSSAIVSAMRAVSPKLDLHTFSFISSDPATNEERWVDIACNRSNAHVHKVTAGPEELLSDWIELLDHQDEPFGSSSIYAQFCVFRAAREAGVPVMLDGQGADEMFAGYGYFWASRLASLIRQGKWSEFFRLTFSLLRRPGGSLANVGAAVLKALINLAPDPADEFAREIMRTPLCPAWLNAQWFQENGVEIGCGRFHKRSQKLELLREHLLSSLEEISLPMLLRYEDRNSMAHSVESRVPFLTLGFVEFIVNLPEHYLIGPNGNTKRIFRFAMRGLVPDAILDRKDKIGFATPEKSWLISLRPWVEKTLASDSAQSIPAICIQDMQEEWKQFLEGKMPFDFRFWRWVNLINWVEHNQVQFDQEMSPIKRTIPSSQLLAG